MKKLSGCISCMLLLQLSATSQDEGDAIRYGISSYIGTARSMSMGNALGSVGADFTTLSINPAGIGVYRRGELSITPSLNISGNNATYQGEQSKESSSKLNIAQFGLVFSSARKGEAYKKSAWKAGSFAFGMNRTLNFKNEYSYTGVNRSSSVIEKFAEEFNALGGINAINMVSYPAYAAYQTWLLDRGFGADSTRAVSYVPFADGIRQTKHVFETGSMQEYVISGGGNYMEKLMLGVTLGIPYVSYDRTLWFDEEDISGKTDNDFSYMNFTEELRTTGTGINLKLGAIYKPVDQFRLGFAFHTPTYIQFNDISTIWMESHTDSLLISSGISTSPVTSYNQDTALVFNYAQTTPYKAIGSASFFFGQSGFVSADVEFLNYASMRYNYGQGFENESALVNSLLRSSFRSTMNIRLGGEWRLKQFALRAGGAYYGSPYRNPGNAGARMSGSAGLGYRMRNWYADFAYVYSAQNQSQLPYALSRPNANVQQASIQHRNSLILLTLGLKFAGSRDTGPVRSAVN